MIQSCFLFTFFIIFLFIGTAQFISSQSTLAGNRGARLGFLIGLLIIYTITVFISEKMPVSPLSHNMLPLLAISSSAFLGIVGISFIFLEFFPSLVKILNNSISFTILMGLYFLKGGSYVKSLNEIFEKVFIFQPTEATAWLPISAFPYYLLIHYFYWNTLDRDFLDDSKLMRRLRILGITKRDEIAGPDYKSFKDSLFYLHWVSYFIVLNFAMNTALIVTFIAVLLDPH